MHDVNGSLFVLLLVLTLACAVWLTRDHWRTARCGACHMRKPFLAPTCWHCGTRQPRLRGDGILLCAGLLVSSGLYVQAQGVQHLDCAQVRLLAEDCEETPEVLPQPSMPPVPPVPPAPLFTKDTVARDTPPVLLQMLQDPAARTPQQARRFVAHEQEKERILREVHRLIQDATPPRPPR